MGTMRGAERVIDVEVAQGGQLLTECGVVLLFLGVEAQVLQQQDLARSGFQGCDLGPHAIGRHLHRPAE